MRLLLLLFILVSVPAFSARGKHLTLEPELGLSYAKWSQDITSPTYEGKMGGNNTGYRYGGNLHYALGKRITLGYSYKKDELTWGYAQSSATGDDEWTSSSKASEVSHAAFLGFRFKSFIMIFQYIFDSELNFNKYYNTLIEKAELKGSGLGLKIQRPLTKRLYWGVTFRQVKYTEGTFDGDNFTFGTEKDGFNFSNKTVQSIILDVSLPIGIF